MRKLFFLAAVGAGYVLGAKAGRQRYEQIKRLSRQVKDNPKVQGMAGMLEAQAESVVDTVKSKVSSTDYPTTRNEEIKENPAAGV
ncbi:hypothetical protein [Cumulibacter manganitolerans]|uniref:hypothetical protein n=1 Tax=Cumulibacter manganitolerans TaxID=1884992 RepID=UPI001295257E|nr:hypothetical protein [Cumulibacter manganitolerans]